MAPGDVIPGEHSRETNAGFAGNDLRCACDQIKKKRLLRDYPTDRAEMGVLHHPMALNQGIHYIAATKASVTTQPHGMVTFLEID